MHYKKFISFALLLAGMLTVVSCDNPVQETKDAKEANATLETHNFQVRKVTDYLYEATLDYDFDYSVAKPYIEKFKPKLGACTAISIGKYRGRNLDWNYGDGAEYVVRTTKTENRHASIGVASLTSLPNEAAGDGQYHQEFELLPFITLDGTNDAGISVNLNVVNFQEMGKWEMKTETEDDDMVELFAPRLILDNCSYLTDIIPLLEQYDWFSLGNVDETHFMVTGPRSADDNTVTTVVFEYIPFTEGGKTFRKLCCISQDEKDIVLTNNDASRFYCIPADIFIMTNFHLWQFDASKDRKGRLLSATKHPMGFERYEIVEAAANTAIHTAGGKDKLTKLQVQDIMRTVYYSNCYNLFQDNFWYTENGVDIPSKEELIAATEEQKNPRGDINKLIKGEGDKFLNYTKESIENWAKRDRKVKSDLWETMHTTIFDYEDRSFQINVHEGTVFYDFKL